jgi:hypothetical protein
MTVITEDLLRKKILKKELQAGADYFIAENSVITPAAHSYLREHQITVRYIPSKFLAVEPVNEHPSSTIKVSLSVQVVFEIKKLNNLLYFPFLEEHDVSSGWWLYFEEQQKWLTAFSKDQKPKLNQKMNHAFTNNKLPSANNRRWQYSLNEVTLQIELVTELLKQQPEAMLADFIQWAQHFKQTVKAETK